jgi:hypothetical protein
MGQSTQETPQNPGIKEQHPLVLPLSPARSLDRALCSLPVACGRRHHRPARLAPPNIQEDGQLLSTSKGQANKMGPSERHLSGAVQIRGQHSQLRTHIFTKGRPYTKLYHTTYLPNTQLQSGREIHFVSVIRQAENDQDSEPPSTRWCYIGSFLFCRSFSCHFQIDPADLQSSINSTVLVHLPTNILKQSSINSTVLVHLPTNILKDMVQQAVTRVLMEVPEQNVKAINRPYKRPEDNSSSTIYETRHSCRSWRGKTPSEGHTASSSFLDKGRLDSSGLQSLPKTLDHPRPERLGDILARVS